MTAPTPSLHDHCSVPVILYRAAANVVDQHAGAAVAPLAVPMFVGDAVYTPATVKEILMRDVTHLFGQAMEAAGLEPPEVIHADGRLHRFSTNGRRGDDAGWYVLYESPCPWGAFGCWRSGFEGTWAGNQDVDLSEAARAEMRARIQRAHRQRDAEMARVQAASREDAISRLVKSKPVVSHPYLTAKAVQPVGITADGERLLVPLHDNQGNVHSLQTIYPNGDKRFLRGGKVTGNYFLISEPATCIILCEGYATGLTLHQCLGHAVAVAFCSRNLAAVAQALRRKYPDIQIIVAADDDWCTPGNPGRAAAKAAALAVGGSVAVPIFPAGRSTGDTDFNDLYRVGGPEDVVACFPVIEED